MRYRSLGYSEPGGLLLCLDVEPMVEGPDRVLVPSVEAWDADAPGWAVGRRDEILERLRSIAWNRDLTWEDGPGGFCTGTVVAGSVEDTQAGRYLEDQCLFEPEAAELLGREQARDLWSQVALRHAQAATGEAHVFAAQLIPGSVFAELLLPALEANEAATIVRH
jgi:hypothetical protein